MITKHLTEEEVQQYALDNSGTDADSVQHVTGCESCQARVTSYQLLFTALDQQQPASFGFDLTSLVLESMNQPVRRPLWISVFIVILSMFALVLPVIFIIQYRYIIAGFFEGLAPLVIPLTATAVCTTLVLLIADMYKSYKKKLTLLGLN